MNQLLQIKHTTLVLLSVLLLSIFATRQSVLAVSPPPDGGYPGGNTAEGTNALLSLTTGQYNTAVGLNSLSSTTGNFNTAIGSAALRFNTTSDSNTAVGTYALFGNKFGDDNTAVGDSALYSNTAGDFNTAVGELAMLYNTTGGTNTAVGDSALLRNTRGDFNTAIGRARSPTTPPEPTTRPWDILLALTSSQPMTLFASVSTNPVRM